MVDINMRKGLFITFEGIGASGKSTQARLLYEHFQSKNRPVLLTREPGGSDLAERLRNIILSEEISGVTEALLLFAAREDHLNKVIRPALEEGTTVICDRFIDSSYAYQGGCRGVNFDFLKQLELYVLRGLQPDLTFFLDIEPDVALARLQVRGADGDKFDREKRDFFYKLRKAYVERSRFIPLRCVTISATQSIEEIHKSILEKVEAKYHES